MSTVYNFINRENIRNFPIDPFEIIKRNNWGLITYTELAKEHNTSIENIVKAFQSNDGYVMLDDHNYTIAYNDTIKYYGRIRFTLMHEIGHIELNHLKDFDETILLRSKLTKSEYDILEREAHAFARNTLAPAVLIDSLETHRTNQLSTYELTDIFLITNQAAKTRKDMFDWDLQHSQKYKYKLIGDFKNFINNLIFGKQCVNCLHNFAIKESNFCPICGNQKFNKKSRGNFNMIYTHIALDEEMRVTQCPRCSNEEVEGNYCKICAMFLFNTCTGFDPNNDDPFRPRVTQWGKHDQGCDNFLDGNARFCINCGSTTSFYEDKLLLAWNIIDEEKEHHEEEVQKVLVSSNGSPFVFDDDDPLPF